MASPGRRMPARFSARAWQLDMAASTPPGVEVARAARSRCARHGVPVAEMHSCEAEHRDGTSLPNCFKVYLPPAGGRFGMVFEFVVRDGRPELIYLAFGVRHHPPGSRAPTVYAIAHRRLQEDWPDG